MTNSPQWLLFSHGLVFAALNNCIEGTVTLPEEADDPEGFLDQLAHAATGNEGGLVDFSYRTLGDSRFFFAGEIDECVHDNGEVTPVGFDSPRLREALKAQYGLTDACVAHAIDSAGSTTRQNDEARYLLRSGLELRCPAYPDECEYVRLVIPGHIELETAYWHADELRDDPADTLGAILGAVMAARGNDTPQDGENAAAPPNEIDASVLSAALDARIARLEDEMPDTDGELTKGYRHALHSMTVALSAQGLDAGTILTAIESANDAFINHADQLELAVTVRPQPEQPAEPAYVVEGLERNEAIWLDVGGFSLRLKRTDEGLVVDLYAGADRSEAVGSTYGFDGENDGEETAETSGTTTATA